MSRRQSCQASSLVSLVLVHLVILHHLYLLVDHHCRHHDPHNPVACVPKKLLLMPRKRMTASRISIPRVALALLVCECTRKTSAFAHARSHCVAITSSSGSSFRTPLQRDALLPSRGGSSTSALRVSTKLDSRKHRPQGHLWRFNCHQALKRQG